MIFAKRLREGVRRGEITLSVWIWERPRVKVGGRYRMEEGEIEVESVAAIDFADITPDLAMRSGFAGVIDLLRTAKHGKGENIYLIRFPLPAAERWHWRPGWATTSRQTRRAHRLTKRPRGPRDGTSLRHGRQAA